MIIMRILFLKQFADYIFDMFIWIRIRFSRVLIMVVFDLFSKAIWFISAHMDALVINNWESWWPYLFIKLFSLLDYILPSAVSVCLNLFLRVAPRPPIRYPGRHSSWAWSFAFPRLRFFVVGLIRGHVVSGFSKARELLNNFNCFFSAENHICGFGLRRLSL